MNERIDRWDVLLRNWCLYYFGGGSLGGESSLCRIVVVDRYWGDQTYEIATVGDAIDTDRLINKLRPQQSKVKVIKAWYWWSGTRESVAKDMGMSKQTLWRHVGQIKDDLRGFEIETRRAVAKNKISNAASLYASLTH